MPPKASFSVFASSSVAGQLEIQVEENIITVFGWVSSTI